MAVPHTTYWLLIIGLVAASQSGNLVRLGYAHPVVMTSWRLLLASVVLLPFAFQGLHRLRTLCRRDKLFLGLAGIALSLHLITWIAAVQSTTVANAAIFLSINPVITSIAAHFIFKERFSMKLLASIILGLAGIVVIGWNDFSFNRDCILGDTLSLLCALLFSIYFLLGKRLRPRISTEVYVVTIYSVAATVGFLGVALLGLPVVAYDGQTWLCFLLLALIPTIIGHTAFNHALKYLDAGRVAASTLCEAPLAGIVAYFAWKEPLTLQMGLGYSFIAASVLLLVLDRQK